MRKQLVIDEAAAMVERSDEDMAFDPAVARKCDNSKCTEPGAFRPVLLLQQGRDYVGALMRFPLGIVVCGQHREKFAEPYLTWLDIVAWFVSRGRTPPHRASTRLDFEPHGVPCA